MSAQVQILGPTFSTFVRTVMLCCEEKGISYEAKFEVDGTAITMKSDTHYTYHPFGRVPILLHDGHQLFETATICRYLENVFAGPELQPEATHQQALIDQWAAALSIYVNEAIVRNYLLEFVFPKGENGEIRMNKIKEAEPELVNTLTLLTTQLGHNDYICGDQYSYADAILTPMLDYLEQIPQGKALLGHETPLALYLKRMRRRPAAQNVLGPMTH